MRSLFRGPCVSGASPGDRRTLLLKVRPTPDQIRRVRVLARTRRKNGDQCGEGARQNKRATSADRDGAQAHLSARGAQIASPSSPTFELQGADAPRPEGIVSTYFDTASHELARRGLSLRVRAMENTAFKRFRSSDANGGAVMSRGEREWPVDAMVTRTSPWLPRQAPVLSDGLLRAPAGRQSAVSQQRFGARHRVDFQGPQAPSSMTGYLDRHPVPRGPHG